MDKIVWLDVLCVNQHLTKERVDEDWKDLLKPLDQSIVDSMRDTVASTKKTLFFMDPECSALNRIWCLYELWQTVDPPPGKSKSAKD